LAGQANILFERIWFILAGLPVLPLCPLLTRATDDLERMVTELGFKGTGQKTIARVAAYLITFRAEVAAAL
jgi:hypothetical protein